MLVAAAAMAGFASAAYDPKLATYLADLSDFAYQNPVPSIPWLSHMTVHDDQGSANSRAVVAVDEERKYILIFFRGSVTEDLHGGINLQNWIDNFNVAHEEWPSWLVDPYWYAWDFWSYYNTYKAHAGFTNHWGSMYYEVKANLEQLLPGRDDYEIIFTGHSLGGCAAQIGALDLHHMMGWGNRKPIVYTFGSLRIFNYMLKEYYESILGDTTWRITYKRDIAPHFPPCGSTDDWWEPCTNNDGSENTWASYFHAGPSVHYEDYSDDFTICTYSEDPACAYRYWADSLTTMSVPDHLGYTEDVVYDDQCLDVRLSSVNYGAFLQENNGGLFTEGTATDLGKWHIIPGLANPDCYTFESTTSPGTYITHSGDTAVMGTNANYEEATFCVRDPINTGYTPAAPGEKIISLEAHSAPGRYLRHANNVIRSHTNDGSNLFSQDATWRMTCL